MTDRETNEDTTERGRENSFNAAPRPVNKVTLVVVVVTILLVIIGGLLIGGFFSFANGGANQNTNGSVNP